LRPIRARLTPAVSRQGESGKKARACLHEWDVPIGIRKKKGAEDILAEGQPLDGGRGGCGGRPPDDPPGSVLLPGCGGLRGFFGCGRVLSSRLVFAPDLGRPEAGGAKGNPSADSLPPSHRLGGNGNICRRLYGAILHGQASLLDPSGGSFLPVHLQLPASPAGPPQMVVPAGLTKSTGESGVRLILHRGLC